jgi:hypothetical protein
MRKVWEFLKGFWEVSEYERQNPNFYLSGACEHPSYGDGDLGPM